MSAESSAGNTKVAFVGWNEFQLTTFRRLIEALFNDCYCDILLVEPPSGFSPPSHAFFEAAATAVKVYSKGDIQRVDQFYDVIVAQTVFPGIEKIQRAALVFMQYGLAKENYNYGVWRSLADLNLVFGPYSHSCMNFFCNAAIVGNYIAAIARPATVISRPEHKKTLLYLPTWGELSSSDLVLPVLAQVADLFEIYIKPHHNTLLAKNFSMREFENTNLHVIESLGGSVYDYLASADVVVSDWSGALYDALYMSRPVILMRPNRHYSHRLVDSGRGLDFAAERLVYGVAETSMDLVRLLRSVGESESSGMLRSDDLGWLFSRVDPAVIGGAVKSSILGVGVRAPHLRQRCLTPVLRLLVRSRMTLQERCLNCDGVERIFAVAALKTVLLVEAAANIVLGIFRSKFSVHE